MKDTKKLPAKVDMFTYKDCEKVIEYLEETEKDIVINKKLYYFLKKKYSEEVNQIMKNKFNIEESKENVILINNQK